MSETTEQVFIKALSLPTRARAALVQRLLVSLEDQESSQEAEEAWKKEALDRCKAFDEGSLTEREAATSLREAGIQERAYEENDGALHVFCKGEDSKGDLEWFTKVLGAVSR